MTPAGNDLPAALLFDVFGTLVDWRSSLIGQLTEFGELNGIGTDWASFADDWRREYAPSMDRVRRGEVPWKNLDTLHRESFDTLLTRYGIEGISDSQRDRISRAWHTLAPWADVVSGLARLREQFIIASLSNGNIALQVDLCRHARLPFDMLFSAELFEHYKPDKQTYLGACALLNLPPARVLLVAAHQTDLQAAKAFGLQTAFLARPLEYGSRENAAELLVADFDYCVTSVELLADRLGA